MLPHGPPWRGVKLRPDSGTLVDQSGRTLSGQTGEAFYASVRHTKPMCVGLNCALGAQQMAPFLERLSKVAECFVHVYSNAGLPNAMGGYDDTPADMARYNEPFVQKGWVNLLGGCCGSTPQPRLCSEFYASLRGHSPPFDALGGFPLHLRAVSTENPRPSCYPFTTSATFGQIRAFLFNFLHSQASLRYFHESTRNFLLVWLPPRLLGGCAPAR